MCRTQVCSRGGHFEHLVLIPGYNDPGVPPQDYALCQNSIAALEGERTASSSAKACLLSQGHISQMDNPLAARSKFPQYDWPCGKS